MVEYRDTANPHHINKRCAVLHHRWDLSEKIDSYFGFDKFGGYSLDDKYGRAIYDFNDR
jgi:hypothetical protein